MKLTAEQRAFEPRGGARQLWLCKDERVLCEGPAGSGKSRAVLEKLYFMAMKYPGMRGLIVRKTRASITESVLVTFEEKVVPPKSKWVTNNLRKVRQAYQLPNGSSIVVAGMDNPDRIMSTEYDVICCFEATELTLDDFEKLTTRLRNFVIPNYQQIIMDCNPGSPTHWLNMKANEGVLTRVLSRHVDNPILFDKDQWTPNGKKYLDGLRSVLTGARAARLLEGKWAAQEGLVYEEFDAAKNVIPGSIYPHQFKIPSHWRRFRVIDFGFNNPFVCQWWALNDDDEVFMYREIYKRNRLVEDHARQIKLHTGIERVELTIADHDREDRETLHRHGVLTIPARKDILNGIEAVKKRLRTTAQQPRPRMYFFADVLTEKDEPDGESGLKMVNPTNCTIEEFDAYSYRKGEDGKPIKEEPVDKDNHGMDCIRYLCAHIDGLGPARVRSFTGMPPTAIRV